MDGYYNLIYDIDELKYFYENILPPLKSTEVYFVSLSARNKYLTNEEREYLDLGRTEMFCKNIVRKREWDRFKRTIRKFECHKEGYTTRNGFSIPEKCMVCYVNINPSSTPRAIAEFKKVLSEYEIELSSIALEGRQNSNNIAERLNKLDNSLMTAYQQSMGTKHWIDIDLDVEKQFKPYENQVIKDYMQKKGLKTYYWIDTKSGYHLLIRRDELKFNPEELTSFCIEEEYKKYWINQVRIPEDNMDYEIVVNKNYMIPMPGTLQGGYPVSVIKC